MLPPFPLPEDEGVQFHGATDTCSVIFINDQMMLPWSVVMLKNIGNEIEVYNVKLCVIFPSKDKNVNSQIKRVKAATVVKQ